MCGRRWPGERTPSVWPVCAACRSTSRTVSDRMNTERAGTACA
ncbi:DUF3039 domain-containing protein [Paraburkholderia sp.]